jgi:hypothetical protein
MVQHGSKSSIIESWNFFSMKKHSRGKCFMQTLILNMYGYNTRDFIKDKPYIRISDTEKRGTFINSITA